MHNIMIYHNALNIFEHLGTFLTHGVDGEGERRRMTQMRRRWAEVCLLEAQRNRFPSIDLEQLFRAHAHSVQDDTELRLHQIPNIPMGALSYCSQIAPSFAFGFQHLSGSDPVSLLGPSSANRIEGPWRAMKGPIDPNKSKWISRRLSQPINSCPVGIRTQACWQIWQIWQTLTDTDRSEAAILWSNPKVRCPVQSLCRVFRIAMLPGLLAQRDCRLLSNTRNWSLFALQIYSWRCKREWHAVQKRKRSPGDKKNWKAS